VIATCNSTALPGLYSFPHYITWALILGTPIRKEGGVKALPLLHSHYLSATHAYTQ